MLNTALFVLVSSAQARVAGADTRAGDEAAQAVDRVVGAADKGVKLHKDMSSLFFPYG